MKKTSMKQKLPKKFNINLSINYTGVNLKKPIVKVKKIK